MPHGQPNWGVHAVHSLVLYKQWLKTVRRASWYSSGVGGLIGGGVSGRSFVFLARGLSFGLELGVSASAAAGFALGLEGGVSFSPPVIMSYERVDETSEESSSDCATS